MSKKSALGKVVMAVAVYEVAAYAINYFSYQSALTGGGGLGFQMPFDLLGQFLGYGGANVTPGASTTGTPLVAGAAQTLNTSLNAIASGAQSLATGGATGSW
jgi:hypothetical protein